MSEPSIEIVNAIIEIATIGFSRGCFLDSWVHVKYDGAEQGFGGFVLGGTSDTAAGQHQEQSNIAAEWIVSVLRAADVDEWSKLPGKAIRVRREEGFSGRILGIGHITKADRWFLPTDRFALMAKTRA